MYHVHIMCSTLHRQKWNLHQKCWLIQQCSRTRETFLKNRDSSSAYITWTYVSLWLVFLKQTRQDFWKRLGGSTFCGFQNVPLGTISPFEDNVKQPVCHCWRCKAASVPLAGKTSEEGLCHTFIISSSSSVLCRSQTTCVFMSASSPQRHNTALCTADRVYSPPLK